MRTINRIVLHHSASPRDTTTWDDIYKWHVRENGWNNIGYHWLFAYDGQNELGRPLKDVGAHAYGRNKDSLGFCLYGDFNKEHPTINQYNALNEKLKYFWNMGPAIQEKFGIKLAESITIEAHRDPKKEGDGKPCPGRNFDWSKVINPWDAAEPIDDDLTATELRLEIDDLKKKIVVLEGTNNLLEDAITAGNKRLKEISNIANGNTI